MGFLDDFNSDSKNSDVCKCAAGSATQLPNLESEYFKTVAKTPVK